MKSFKKPRKESDLQAATIIAECLNKITQKQGHAVFAIPGGSSVLGIFKKLLHQDINWSKVHIFMVDERLVSVKHRESNFKLAKETFLDKLKIPKKNIHPFEINKGLANYTQQLQQQGGKFDVILLSSGEDGHVASLFPNHHSVTNQSQLFLSIKDAPKTPPKRMTASKHLLLKATVAILLFYGEGKKKAYHNFQKNLPISKQPAQLVKRIKKAYVFTDL